MFCKKVCKRPLKVQNVGGAYTKHTNQLNYVNLNEYCPEWIPKPTSHLYVSVQLMLYSLNNTFEVETGFTGFLGLIPIEQYYMISVLK